MARYRNPADAGGGRYFLVRQEVIDKGPASYVAGKLLDRLEEERRQRSGHLSFAALRSALQEIAAEPGEADRLYGKFQDLKVRLRDLEDRHDRLRNRALRAREKLEQAWEWQMAPDAADRQEEAREALEDAAEQLRQVNDTIEDTREKMKSVLATLRDRFYALRAISRGPVLRMPEDGRTFSGVTEVPLPAGSGSSKPPSSVNQA